MTTYLWPWLYREVISTLQKHSDSIDEPLMKCFPTEGEDGSAGLPLRLEQWLSTRDAGGGDVQPPPSDLETPLDEAVRDATGTLTDFVQETLCHPFFLRRLSMLNQQGELPSALFQAFQKSGIRRTIAACLVEYTHKPVCHFILYLVSRRYNSYVAMLRQCDLSLDVKKQLIEIGNRFWLGGDAVNAQVDFYNVALPATEGSEDDRRRLTRAWMVLSSRSGAAALRGAIESLKTVASGKILFPKLQQKLDDLVAGEDVSEGATQIAGPEEDHCNYGKATLGGRIHQLTHAMLDQVDTFLSADKLEPLFTSVIRDQRKEAPRLADELQEHHDDLVQCSAQVLHAAAHQGVHLIQNRLERVCALFYRHDLSRFIEQAVQRLRIVINTYMTHHSKGQPVKSLLRCLRNSLDANTRLHPCVPASADPKIVHDHDQDYLQHHLLPAVKKLLLPSGIGQEIINLLFPNPGPLSGTLEELGDVIEPAIDSFLKDMLSDWLEALTDPTGLNRMILDGIEGAWQRKIEEARAAGKHKEADKLTNLWECYVPKKAEREELVDQAGLALGYAVSIWVEAPYPGIHPLLASLVKHVHKTYFQHPALIKNLLYHMLDGFFYPLTESMATAKRHQDKILRRPGEVHSIDPEGGPFDDHCMDKLAGFVIFALQSGGDYLAENDDLSSMDRVKASLVRAGLDSFTDAALNMVKGSLPGLVPVEGMLTFPGLISLLLGAGETFAEEQLPELLQGHYEQLLGEQPAPTT